MGGVIYGCKTCVASAAAFSAPILLYQLPAASNAQHQLIEVKLISTLTFHENKFCLFVFSTRGGSDRVLCGMCCDMCDVFVPHEHKCKCHVSDELNQGVGPAGELTTKIMERRMSLP